MIQFTGLFQFFCKYHQKGLPLPSFHKVTGVVTRNNFEQNGPLLPVIFSTQKEKKES